MASSDLEQFFNIIRTASSGEAVRDAIIDAAKTIRTAANNSLTLGGIKYTEFATRSEYDKLVSALYDKIKYDQLDSLKDDDEYATTSENVMNSGNMYDILKLYLRPALSTIMHYEYDPLSDKESKEAVKTYLKYLEEAKGNMYNAILAKTKPHWNNYDFRDFEYMIQHITDDVPELDAGRFTKDGVYDAGENKEERRAYETIDVNVPDSELKVTGNTSDNNSTHTPPEGKLFSSFSVNIANAASSRSSSIRGRSGGSGGGEVDEDGFMDVKEIVENGTYTAAGDAVTGYRRVSVHVTEDEASGTYTVTFVNGDDTLDTQEVPAYGSAYYNGPKPTNPNSASDETEFYGWDPLPLRVTSSMTCYAQFRIPQPVDPSEISDSWEEIVACRGSKYQKGQYKTLSIGTVGGTNYGSLIMQKVADGVSNATSVWISKTAFHSSLFGGTNTLPWPISPIRKFYNGKLFEILSTSQTGMLICDNVVPMELTTMATWVNWPNVEITTSKPYHTFCEYKTVDEFWVPSAYEMFGDNGIYDKGEFSFYELIRHSHNDRKVGSLDNPEQGSLALNPYASPMPPNLDGYEMNVSSSMDYSSVYGGIVISYETNEKRSLAYTPKDASKYIKYSSTATSTPTTYTLRSLRRYSSPNASDTLWKNNWAVTNTGAISTTNHLYATAYPVGFGL